MFKMIRAAGGLLATILHRLTAPVNPLLQRGSNDLKLLDLSPRCRWGPGPDAGENARIGGLAPVGVRARVKLRVDRDWSESPGRSFQWR